MSLKCVIVGNDGVGKTCVMISYSNREFRTEFVPTVMDNYSVAMRYNEKYVSLGVWDTAGHEDYERLRPLTYPGTNVFGIVFSLVDYESFESSKTKWYPEIRRHSKDSSIVLIGNKLDLRKDKSITKALIEQGDKVVSKEEGEKLANELKLCGYIECSARSLEGIDDVFQSFLVNGLKNYVSCNGINCGICQTCTTQNQNCTIL